MTRTAQWHLDEAERLYEQSKTICNTPTLMMLLAQAQYHATMAVAVSSKPKAYPNTGPK